MKTAIELFKECAENIKTAFPRACEVEQLRATLALVDLSIKVEEVQQNLSDE